MWIFLSIINHAFKSRRNRELLPWAILGCYPDDPIQLVNDIYRIKAGYYHPDRGGNKNKMVKLNEAYSEIQRRLGIR